MFLSDIITLISRSVEIPRQDLRMQLSQERDSVRHLTLQKDIELKELRNRIDKDVSDSTPLI